MCHIYNLSSHQLSIRHYILPHFPIVRRCLDKPRCSSQPEQSNDPRASWKLRWKCIAMMFFVATAVALLKQFSSDLQQTAETNVCWHCQRSDMKALSISNNSSALLPRLGCLNAPVIFWLVVFEWGKRNPFLLWRNIQLPERQPACDCILHAACETYVWAWPLKTLTFYLQTSRWAQNSRKSSRARDSFQTSLYQYFSFKLGPSQVLHEVFFGRKFARSLRLMGTSATTTVIAAAMKLFGGTMFSSSIFLG